MVRHELLSVCSPGITAESIAQGCPDPPKGKLGDALQESDDGVTRREAFEASKETASSLVCYSLKLLEAGLEVGVGGLLAGGPRRAAFSLRHDTPQGAYRAHVHRYSFGVLRGQNQWSSSHEGSL